MIRGFEIDLADKAILQSFFSKLLAKITGNFQHTLSQGASIHGILLVYYWSILKQWRYVDRISITVKKSTVTPL